MALTGKKRAFADAVLAGKTNKDAAIKAGYSIATASAAGSRLVKDKFVVAYLSERRKAAPKSGKQSAEMVSAAPPMTPAFDINAAISHRDPMSFLLVAMNDMMLDPKLRIDSAKALLAFMHQKVGEGGKKDAKAEAAKKAAGRFTATPPPLRAIQGGK